MGDVLGGDNCIIKNQLQRVFFLIVDRLRAGHVLSYGGLFSLSCVPAHAICTIVIPNFFIKGFWKTKVATKATAEEVELLIRDSTNN